MHVHVILAVLLATTTDTIISSLHNPNSKHHLHLRSNRSGASFSAGRRRRGLRDVVESVEGTLIDLEYGNQENPENLHHGDGRPNVVLDYGNFIGGTSADVESFTAIPFAEPPVGRQRLMNPEPPRRTYPNYDATKVPSACPQKSLTAGPGPAERIITEAFLITQYQPVVGSFAVGNEDCLTLDVRRPQGVTEGANLPVMVYLFGGGGEVGSTNTYDGSFLVAASIKQSSPIIYVAISYRTNGFGFLPGREVGAEGVGNLGLKDQRLGLKWVQRYISKFGGDPSKVTLFGESAGAISVSHQILAYNGNHEGLFRAAICQSGTALSTTTFADGGGQSVYDQIVRNSGCEGHTNTLQCLRELDFDTYYRAIATVDGPLQPDGVPFKFVPHIDGEIVTDTLDGSLSKGNYARVPIITGDQDDEGTLLTMGLLSIGTEDRLREYLSSTFYQSASLQQIDEILRLYPQDPAAGSPYDTGDLNTLTPVFKQVASLFGDSQFEAPRRKFSQGTQAHMPVWGYIDKGYKHVPYLGAFHTTDLPNVFGYLPGGRTVDYQSRWIAFANTMNPNVEGLPHWPNYGDDGSILLMGPNGSEGCITDNFREEAINYINQHSDELGLRSK